MTTVTINSDFEFGFLNSLVPLFAKIIREDAASTTSWEKRMKSVKTHGLISFSCESNFKPAEIEVDSSRLNDPRYRRWLVRKLKAPRPSSIVSHEIRMDRERILNDDEYLGDMAKLLSYKWMRKLSEVDSDIDRLLLLKSTETSLRSALDRLGMHESDAETVAAIVMRTFAEEALDGNETLKRVEAEIRAAGAEALHSFREEMAPLNERVLTDFGRSMDEYLAKVSSDVDEFITAMRARMSVVAASNERALAANAARDEESEWREMLAASDARRRAARREMSWLARIFN